MTYPFLSRSTARSSHDNIKVSLPQALRIGMALDCATWLFTFFHFQTHPQLPNDVVLARRRTGEFQVAPAEKCEEWWNASPRTQGASRFFSFPFLINIKAPLIRVMLISLRSPAAPFRLVLHLRLESEMTPDWERVQRCSFWIRSIKHPWKAT